jgi:hypothetical protein
MRHLIQLPVYPADMARETSEVGGGAKTKAGTPRRRLAGAGCCLANGQGSWLASRARRPHGNTELVERTVALARAIWSRTRDR